MLINPRRFEATYFGLICQLLGRGEALYGGVPIAIGLHEGLAIA
jgi:hypothetical protein